MDHLGHGIVHVLDREADGALHAVQVVVDAKPAKHEKRRRDATQTQLVAEAAQEYVLYILDSLLRLVQIQQRLISFRFQKFAHIFNCSAICLQKYCFYSYLQTILAKKFHYQSSKSYLSNNLPHFEQKTSCL